MISIFAKRAFLNTNPSQEFISKERSYKGNGHLQRVSSIIRADQIAVQIEARLNPTSGYEDDTCIYVKPYVLKGHDFKFEGKKNYLDIIDGHNLGHLALQHPEVGVITCSKLDFEIMSKSLPNNKVVFIPQHHCNFERVKRSRNGITRVGIIGEEPAFTFLPEGLRDELERRGIELVTFSKFFSREDIINFYLSIDVQIVWRPYKKILSNPLKIVNAASFGIPTIALDEPAFKEVENCYVPVRDLREFFAILDGFQKGSLYTIYAEECLKRAEEYHIEKVAELYKQL